MFLKVFFVSSFLLNWSMRPKLKCHYWGKHRQSTNFVTITDNSTSNNTELTYIRRLIYKLEHTLMDGLTEADIEEDQIAWEAHS